MTESRRIGFEPRSVGGGQSSDLFGQIRRVAAEQGSVCPATLLLHKEGKFCIDYKPPSGVQEGFCIQGRCRNSEVLAARQQFDADNPI